MEEIIHGDLIEKEDLLKSIGYECEMGQYKPDLTLECDECEDRNTCVVRSIVKLVEDAEVVIPSNRASTQGGYMTNREWLATLSDEDLATWATERDVWDGEKFIEPSPTLRGIPNYPSSRLGLLKWLREQRPENRQG